MHYIKYYINIQPKRIFLSIEFNEKSLIAYTFGGAFCIQMVWESNCSRSMLRTIHRRLSQRNSLKSEYSEYWWFWLLFMPLISEQMRHFETSLIIFILKSAQKDCTMSNYCHTIIWYYRIKDSTLHPSEPVFDILTSQRKTWKQFCGEKCLFHESKQMTQFGAGELVAYALAVFGHTYFCHTRQW